MFTSNFTTNSSFNTVSMQNQATNMTLYTTINFATSDPETYNATFITLTTFTVVVGVISVILNGFVIVYFYKKRQEIGPLLYVILAGCDFLSGILAFVHACFIDYILSDSWWGDHGYKVWILAISYIATTVTSRTSIFYNVLLAVSRTINITHPFYLIKKKWVIVSAALYPLFWGCISVADFILGVRVYGWDFAYESFAAPLPGNCIINNDCGANTNATQLTVESTILLGPPFMLPIIIMITCASIQIGWLLKNIIVTDASTQSQQKSMTVTILLITVVCLICNLAYLMFWYLFHITDLAKELSYISFGIIVYACSTTLPFLNAAINPLILVARGSGLREYLRSYADYRICTLSTVYGPVNGEKDEIKGLEACPLNDKDNTTPDTQC